MGLVLRGCRAPILLFATGILLNGCGGLPLGTPRTPPAEYRQKVGLYVDDKIERFHYFGSASGDASNKMAFHLQQTLPARIQAMLMSMFERVELSEPNAQITFKTPDLAGFFSVRTLTVRYDYPDPNLSVYRAEVEMSVEFRTFEHQPVWSTVVLGEGVGYDDPNFRLSEFSRGASSALEDAYQKAVDDIEDEVYKSQSLKEDFRGRLLGS